MVRIAISSDNHLDVNQVNPAETLKEQSTWLLKQHVDYYFFVGDLFNHFSKTRRYFAYLQNRLAGKVKVYYIAGNHDMLNDAPATLIDKLPDDPRYIHNRYVDLANTNWRMIGNNGWYDYSFSTYVNQPEGVRRWKNVYWLDSSIDQPLTDQEQMALVLKQVRIQLRRAQQAHKKVLFLTHFAPRHELLGPKPAVIKTARQERFYQMINAMMGSDHLGEVLEASPEVYDVFYGHLHGQHPAVHRGHVTYFHQAVGVKNKRLNEWQASTFIDQWRQTLRIMDLK